MPRSLSEQVVVITGASSGIGRETALELGRRGASVGLAARNAEALEAVADQIERLGGSAFIAPIDVANWEQVRGLADSAVERYGRIDTWINGAAASLYGTVEQTTAEEIARVIQVTLMGSIHGMKAAAEHMRRQRSGTIINVASGLGRRAVPLQSAYCAAKHGVIGFADSLRLELAREAAGVAVATVLPSSVNTPLFDHARSRWASGRGRSHRSMRPRWWPPPSWRSPSTPCAT